MGKNFAGRAGGFFCSESHGSGWSACATEVTNKTTALKKIRDSIIVSFRRRKKKQFACHALLPCNVLATISRRCNFLLSLTFP